MSERRPACHETASTRSEGGAMNLLISETASMDGFLERAMLWVDDSVDNLVTAAHNDQEPDPLDQPTTESTPGRCDRALSALRLLIGDCS
jgi:hypothetical protein